MWSVDITKVPPKSTIRYGAITYIWTDSLYKGKPVWINTKTGIETIFDPGIEVTIIASG